MRIARVLSRSLEGGLSLPRQHLQTFRFLSTGNVFDVRPPNSNSSESADDFEQRIFGGFSGESAKNLYFFQNLDRLGRARDRVGPSSVGNRGGSFSPMDGLDESFNSLSDGMDGRLKDAATYFDYEEEEEEEEKTEYEKEIDKEGYTYRPDVTFHSGQTYEPKELDLRKPGIRKPAPPLTLDVTTEEVLRKADFRNVRFLANFLTEAGIIIKRSSTGISAKAQRKVAREIKTARAFGLLPFTTMGTKEFRFGKTMQDLDHDYEYENYDSGTTADAADDVD